MRTLDHVLKNSVIGLHYGNRVILPFECELLKIVVDSSIITDFSSMSEDAEYVINDGFTEIYFHSFESLEEKVTQYENIKLVIVEKGKDLFDFENHRKICLSVKENHKLQIKEIDDETLFVE
ncbi:MAG: hypothetical protein K8F60_13010 [Melioribacteraceae bacterium]|nr:hypothetical protein [Ignavibacteriota bacterium]MBZ0183370.1 hypothetical protein [Melioribacteraceae bacterium]